MPRDPERMAQAGLIDRSGEIFFTSSRSSEVSTWLTSKWRSGRYAWGYLQGMILHKKERRLSLR
jgi:hypothetical protein